MTFEASSSLECYFRSSAPSLDSFWYSVLLRAGAVLSLDISMASANIHCLNQPLFFYYKWLLLFDVLLVLVKSTFPFSLHAHQELNY